VARPRAPEHELRREEILDRAAQAFADGSYPGTSMNAIAAACGASKARLYHYYASKEAILFDLLDRYTARLKAMVVEVRAQSLPPRAEVAALVRAFLREYRDSRTRQMALLNDTRHLGDAQRNAILAAQRELVWAMGDSLQRAYPARVDAAGRAAHTMMVFGMINWTFTWLKTDGPLSHEAFADYVIAVLERGLAAPAARSGQ
jgi:AcrR family transcriptional regulator